MPDSFNGYHVWLGIPPSEQPPNHYRLLGIAIFETDLDVIEHAADRQMAHVRTFQSGRNAGLSQQILNELAAARVCLLHPQRKADYDDALRAKLADVPQAAVPVGKALPVAPVATPLKMPGALPQSTPREKPQAKPVPVAKPIDAPFAEPAAETAGASFDDDAYEVDVDLDSLSSGSVDDAKPLAGADGLVSSGPTIKITKTRRLGDRDALLQRLLVYALTGAVALVLFMLLVSMVRRLAGGVDWRDWFKMPEQAAEELVEPEAGKQAQPPPPPAPGAHSAAETPAD